MPLHPKFVHLPLALSVLMPFIFGGLLVAWWRNWLPKKAWLIGILLQIVMTGGAFVAMETGEEEEERVEKVVPHDAMEAHEERAEMFVWSTALLLVFAVLAGVVSSEKIARWFAVAAIGLAFGVMLLGVRTGLAGGQLVYEYGAGSVYTDDAPSSTQENRH